MKVDPKITLSAALDLMNGNQAELARCLGLSRAMVNSWVMEGREYLPPLHAYRFRELLGERQVKKFSVVDQISG